MKIGIYKKFLSALTVATLAFCLILVHLSAPNVYAAAGDTYTQSFTDADAVNEDFAAYYQVTMGSGSERTVVGYSESDNTNWYVSNGELIRKSLDGDISKTFTTDSFAILTLTKKQYVNFDLTVEYRMGAATDYWPVVTFRQQIEGAYFLESGAGVFVQKEGLVTLWGSDVDGVGGPYENPVSDYARDEWHTLRIRVDGLDLDVYLDAGTQPAMSRKLPASMFRSGYISLTSVNNDARFRNLSVTELETKPISDTQHQEPLPDAGTSDSLGSMAESVTQIDELAGHTQQGASDGDTDHKGCGGAARGASLFVSAACILFVSVFLVSEKLYAVSRKSAK